MGFHVCEYCGPEMNRASRYSNWSSGDVILILNTGRSWQMPDMIKHYVADHGFLPPEEFINDVIYGRLSDVVSNTPAEQVLRSKDARKVGYLSGAFPQGDVPEEFTERLGDLMQTAAVQGNRIQTSGFH